MSGFCSLPSHPVNIKFTNLFGKYTGQHMANIYEGWSRFEQEGSLTLPEFQKMIDNLAGNDFKNASIVGRVLNNDTAKGFTSFMVEGIDSRAMNEATVLGVDFVDKATMWTIANSQEFINEFGNWKPAFLALKEGHKRTLVRGRQYSRGMIGKLYPNGEPRVAYLIKFLYEKTKTPEQKAEAVQYFKQAMKSVVGDAYNESLGTIDPNMTEDHRIYEWAEIINGLGGEYTVRILPQTTVEAQRRYVQRLKNYDFISDKRMPELEKSKSFFYTIPKILSDEVVATSRGEWDGYVPTQLDHEKFHVLEEKLRKETGGTMGVKRSKDGTGDAYMFAVDKATLNETEGMKISKDKFQYQRIDEPIVNYHFRAVDNLLKNIAKIRQWEANKSIDENTLYKKIAELGIPKEQLSLIRESEGTTIEEKIASFVAKYSYTVEIATSKVEPVTKEIMENETDNYFDSAFYSTLTVPGGTNYKENRIITPAITPSIKGHPQFAQTNDIGWFRSDEKREDEITNKGNWITSINNVPNEFIFSGSKIWKDKDGNWNQGNSYIEDDQTVIWRYNQSLGNTISESKTTKSRRILEIQSDLFQKGRDKKGIVRITKLPSKFTTRKGSTFIKNEYGGWLRTELNGTYYWTNGIEATNEYVLIDDNDKVSTENDFLQLLNKDGNWIPFFIKSIVQDSAKKGYEKVLFPAGETAAKIEGHETLAAHINSINKDIESIQKDIEEAKIDTRFPKEELNSIIAKKQTTIKELEQRKAELKSQGIEKLKPIEGFYEVRVKNTLDKVYGKQNVTRITDEYGNDWFEITVTEEMREAPIQLQVAEETVKEGVTELFESNPELSSIGTQEQYSQYLDTIFPDSKVKDIVYHGSFSEKFEQFSKEYLGKFTQAESAKLAFFFASNIENAQHYVEFLYRQLNEGLIGDEEIEGLQKKLSLETGRKKQLIKYYDFLKDGYKDTVEYKKAENLIKDYNPTWTNNELFNLQIAIENLGFELKPYIWSILKEQIDSNPTKYKNYNWKSEYKQSNAGLEKEFIHHVDINPSDKLINKYNKVNPKNFIYRVILNIKNPNIYNDNGNNFREESYTNIINNAIDNNNDSAIIKNTKDPLLTDVYSVFEPEQIHTLGSKQDIEGFKKFVEMQGEKPIQLHTLEQPTTEASMELAELTAIADKLSERTGINYRIVEVEEAERELKAEEEKTGVKSKKGTVTVAYFKGDEVVFVNSGQLKADTPFHEFAHPFVDVICKRNAPLFGNLKKKLLGSPAGQKIIEEVKRKYPDLVENGELTEAGWKEAVTTALGRMAANDSLDVAPENRGLWGVIQTLIKAIQNFINRYMLGEGINPISLSANTSFRELADMIGVSEQSIILNKKELDTRIQKQVAGAAPGFRTSEVAKKLVAIRAEISNQIYAVNRSERDRSTKKELLKKLNDMMATIEAGLDTPIDDMVNSAHEALDATTKGIMKDITDLMSELGTKEVGSPEASSLAATILSNLNLINDYIKAFDWLPEIEKGTFKHNKLYEFNTDETTVKMNEAIKMYREAKDFYDSQFKAVLAKTLEPILKEVIVELQPQILQHIKALEAEIKEYEKNGKEKKAERAKKRLEEYEENIASRAPQDAKELEALFSRASKDVAFTEYFLGSAINSRDFVMSLFVKAIAKIKERAMRRTVDDVATLNKAYKEYVGSQSASRDNVEKLNNAVIETVTRYETVTDKDGSRKRIPRTYKMFVQEYDEDTYNKEYEKAIEASKKLKKEGKSTKTFWYNWYQANREPRTPSEQAAIRAAKKRVMTAEEFEAWEKGRGKSELSRPKISIYPNAKWNAMYKTDAAGNWVPISKAGEYHKQILATYLEKQKSYPPAKRQGNILPSVSKSAVDRLWEQGLISGAKNWTKEQFGKFTSDSYVYSNNGSMKDKILPTYYTDYMDAEDVSNNVFASVLLYAKEANNYDELYRTRAELAAMSDVMHERGAKSIGETDEFGNIKERRQNAGMRKALKGAGLTDIDNKETSNLVAWFDAFMEMQVYGKTRKEQTVRIGNKVINVDKKVDALLSFIAKTSLGGGNILKHIANGIQGQVQLAIEAYSQQFFSRKTLASASAAYYAHAPELFSDLGEPYPKSFIGQLLIEFDAIQGQFMDEIGNEMGKSAVNKFFTGGYWMQGMAAGEHFNQTRLLIAMMKNTTVKQNGKDISLWEAYEKNEDGKLQLKTGVEFTAQQRSAFVDKLHSINKGMFGVYNKFDMPVAKRTAQGRMLLLFRSFLYAYWKRRFSPNRIDVESGLEMEGYYSTFFQVMTRRFKDLAFLLGKDVDTLTDVQKANVRRSLAEITIALTLAALAAVLRAADDDDEEKSWAYNALLYEIVRAKSEAMALIPVLGTIDMLRTFSTPSIATTTIQQFSDLVGQIIYDPTGVYERGYGFAEKGDNKAWIKFLRLIGLTRYNLNPDVATKFYLGRVF